MNGISHNLYPDPKCPSTQQACTYPKPALELLFPKSKVPNHGVLASLIRAMLGFRI